MDYTKIAQPGGLGKPQAIYMLGQSGYLYYVPDNIYGLTFVYYADLVRLDETGDLFLNFLREWRPLFVQGLVVKANQLEDEDRYRLEFDIYQNMLNEFQGSHTTIHETEYRDL